MLRRRDCLTGTVAALSAPRVAPAEPPRVGFLFYDSPGTSPELKAFEKGLTDVGYIEAPIGSRTDEQSACPELATQLIGLKPSVIVVPGTPAAVAAKQAAGTTPVVFVGVAMRSAPDSLAPEFESASAAMTRGKAQALFMTATRYSIT